MRWVTRFAALSLTLVAGCIGGYQSGTPGTPGMAGTDPTPGTPGTPGTQSLTARGLFDMNVLPMLSGSCASCHSGTATTGGPKFLGVDGTAYYASLVADPRFVNNEPAQSYLITHHHATGEGPDLNMAQDMVVMKWIAQENVERALPPPPEPANAATAELVKFGKCMTETDFNSTGMNTLQNQGTNGNGGPCQSCHSGQSGGANSDAVYLSNSTTANFQHLQLVPYIMKFALPTVNPDGSFKDIVPANRFLDRGQEAGHPAYTLTTARQQALTNFFQLTYTKYKAGNCATTTTPPDGGTSP